jgi:COP9 signalosome complex subunit 2
MNINISTNANTPCNAQVRLPFISAKLNIPPADVEALLVSLILDGRVTGHIDQASD